MIVSVAIEKTLELPTETKEAMGLFSAGANKLRLELGSPMQVFLCYPNNHWFRPKTRSYFLKKLSNSVIRATNSSREITTKVSGED